MKRVNVILAFHAQEPLWDLPRKVLDGLADEDVKREAVGNDNWVRRRAEANRDIYRGLVEMGARLGATVCLEATNEVLMQIKRFMPDTFSRLGEAYRSGAIYPVYGNAFHTHIAMLTDDELTDELRMNREFLHDVLGAPEPRHAGAFPMEGSIDAHKLAGFTRAGMEYVIFPNLSERKARFAFEGLPEGADPVYGPFTIGDGLLALPRHFPISQEIWRPITKWQPERLKAQGYILGKYWVLDEEYRERKFVEFPIDRPAAVEQYAQVLRDAVQAAPDDALLLYIQDLELMDFGEEALDIMGDAWEAVRAEHHADIRFVTPDDYLDELRDSGRALPHMKFHQVSWAPEIRLVLRSDGHYPPLHAGEFRGVDNDLEVFRRWPFIFWEPGRFIADAFKSLLTSFGHDLAIPLSGAELDARGYEFDDDLDDATKLAMHVRIMQRACNFGWQPDEDRHKWPYMHAIGITEILRAELKRPAVAERVSHSFRPLPQRALEGLDRVLEIFIDTRIAYLRRGIARLGDRAGSDEKRAESEQHLRNAEQRRSRASALIRQVRAENGKFITSCAIDDRGIQRILALMQEHARETFLGINEIQRAWMCIDDTAGMIEQMYEYLYEVYPPRFPQILRELLSEQELAEIDEPALA
ncbi:MAG: hypothetical protein WD359_02405 [Dehalococcoidia bacterium]